jgi:hypothetical protein
LRTDSGSDRCEDSLLLLMVPVEYEEVNELGGGTCDIRRRSCIVVLLDGPVGI